MSAEDIKKRAEKLDEALKDLSSFFNSDTTWTLKKLLDYQSGLFTFAKFRVGDAVCLSRDPVITTETAPGWMHAKHFLVKGAVGVVRSRDWSGRFFYDIEFDNESWVDQEGIVHLAERKHVYGFGEDLLERPLPKKIDE